MDGTANHAEMHPMVKCSWPVVQKKGPMIKNLSKLVFQIFNFRFLIL